MILSIVNFSDDYKKIEEYKIPEFELFEKFNNKHYKIIELKNEFYKNGRIVALVNDSLHNKRVTLKLYDKNYSDEVKFIALNKNNKIINLSKDRIDILRRKFYYDDVIDCYCYKNYY